MPRPHFFDEQLDAKRLERIWKYNILPLVEDQLWGQNEVINSFEWSKVDAAYRSAGGVTSTDTAEDAEPTE